MSDNTIIIGGATQPSTINTPSDKRDRVPTFEDIFKIDNPAQGSGTVWVEDEGREYRIISLKSKMIGGVEIENAAVGEVVPESEIISRSLTFGKEAAENMASAIADNEEAVNTMAGALASDESAIATLSEAIPKFKKIEGDTLYL
jgi:hypothetical protein